MTTSPSDLPKLGRYEILRKIAQGGMAEIFLGKAVGVMGFERLVAIKLIHQHLTRDDTFVKMFIDEARIAMHLQHRNIVQVFDLDQFEGTYFIAMEYVHGVNVYDVYERIAAQNRWFDLPFSLYVIAEVCKGLHFAHTRVGADGRPMGIVHRDISPQNILLSFEGEVKITDFGIAKAAERLHHTTPGIVKGKYAYMAPEILQEAPADPRADVFAAGVVLYELLVGENPFAGKTPVETIENVLSLDVPPPSKKGAAVTRDLDLLVAKALAKDPNKRFQSALDFQEALTDLGLNLTRARREMAAGDAQISELLRELFPDRIHEQGRADPQGVNLPVVQAVQPTAPASQAPIIEVRPEIVPAAPDEEPASGGGDATLLEFEVPNAVKEARKATAVESVGDSGDRTLLNLSGLRDELAKTERASPANPADLAPVILDPASHPDQPARPRTVPQPPPPSPPQPPPPSPPPGVAGPVPRAKLPTEITVEPGLLMPQKKSSLTPILAGLVVALLAVMGAFFMLTGAVPIEVTSDPPGASVTLDGKLLLGRTPLKVDLEAGTSHAVIVEAPGYEPFQTSLLFERGAKPPPISARLVRQEGRITVRPTPKNARVTVDSDTRTGESAFERLELGKTYSVRVDAVGFEPYSATVKLSSAERIAELDIVLTPEK